ncbi:ion transporter [Planctomycetota bacterium]|nr:ion transporter [Planctomycetota bacterium]
MPQSTENLQPLTGLRHTVHQVIFEADTPSGKLFDILLLAAILASVGALMLESVKDIEHEYGHTLRVAEWVFTGLFTLEYFVRLWVVRQRLRYARSFYGVIDLLAILPTYIGLFFAGSHSLAVVRAFRLLRAFRVFKLAHFMVEAAGLRKALAASYPKIIVFLMTVAILVVIFGTTMYLIESGHPQSGFTSIPVSVYWAVVTVTTVGYGDIAPVTALGKGIAACMMVMGYALIVVPTGVITAELTKGDRARAAKLTTQHCANCNAEGHSEEAKHCYNCGAELNPTTT